MIVLGMVKDFVLFGVIVGGIVIILFYFLFGIYMKRVVWIWWFMELSVVGFMDYEVIDVGDGLWFECLGEVVILW